MVGRKVKEAIPALREHKAEAATSGKAGGFICEPPKAV
jgi:hypothetical protein